MTFPTIKPRSGSIADDRPAIAIGMLGFDGVNALDLVGPLEVFATAAQLAGGGRYAVHLIGDGAFTAESGITFTPHWNLVHAPALDTLIVPGGSGLRVPQSTASVAQWVLARASGLRRIASVCTGIYGLAPTGLLDGRQVTTHWRFVADIARRFPALRVVPDAIFVGDGRFFTSAGITAGIDLALALVELDLGPRIALAVARELLVYMKRPGGQTQFSEPLRLQTRGADRLADLVAWIEAHLAEPLEAAQLAAYACLSPRQLSRRVGAAFGCTPAQLVERARMNAARQRLLLPGRTVESVAASVGFASADGFRRAFVRRYGIGPRRYREGFSTTGEGGPAQAGILPLSSSQEIA